MKITFSIPLAPITKKNHQQILVNRSTGKPFVSPSPQYKQYERDALWFIPKVEKPIDFPVNVKCLFFMPTKRKVDLTNLLESIDDIMVKAGLLADDNYTIIASHDGSKVYYDKEKPQTWVEITT
jgi:Holliday junction resolvase RusA-like endonuclease